MTILVIVLIVIGVIWWTNRRGGLSSNEQQYLKRRGYSPDPTLDAGPPVTKDTRLINLIESLGDLSPYARQRAAEDLGRMCADGQKDGRMLSPLLATLDDNDASVRSAAANAVAQFGSADALESLKTRLSMEESIHVRATLQRAITTLENY
jgi:hypothetical protein